jgi:hypothetical protein
MSGVYIGVDGKARKVKGAYIGVDGVARKIKKGYIGDANGVARLCFVDSPYDSVFANNTWEEIALACQTGAVPDSWAVGDQKTMTINGTDYTIDIIGKNHDDYADGSGKAPLTFQLHECYATDYQMNTSSTNDGGWGSSYMRNTRLQKNILPLMPSEVQAALREVRKQTSQGKKSETIVTTSDKLFLLSEVEVLGTTKQSYSGEGSRYAYYTNGGTATKRNITESENISWWLRSPAKSYSSTFVTVVYYGTDSSSTDATTITGVSFAFCF